MFQRALSIGGGGGGLTAETVTGTNVSIDATGVEIVNTSYPNTIFVTGTVTRTGTTATLPHLQLFYEDGTPASQDISGSKDVAVTVSRYSNTGGKGKLILKKVSGDTATHTYSLQVVYA